MMYRQVQSWIAGPGEAANMGNIQTEVFGFFGKASVSVQNLTEI